MSYLVDINFWYSSNPTSNLQNLLNNILNDLKVQSIEEPSNRKNENLEKIWKFGEKFEPEKNGNLGKNMKFGIKMEI